MRLVVGMLAVLLSQSIALAEDAAPSRLEATAETPAAAPAPARQKVPVRVVRILSETNQALLFDRSNGGTHLLVTVGEKIGIYTVEAIDDDEVTLSASGQQIVLAAPDRPWRRRNYAERTRRERPRAVRGGDPAQATPADPYGPVEPSAGAPSAGPTGPTGPTDPYAGAPSAGAPGPADPYAVAPSTGAPGPADPYAGAPSAGAPGPADPYAMELREVRAPAPPPPPAVAPAPVMPPTPAIAPPSITPPMPAPVIAPAPAIGPAIAPAPAADPVLARREVDAALADFGALAVAFRASFTPAGVKVESILDGSLFSKAGLRAGDVIASVEGRPLRSLEDVAALYARAGTLRVVTAQVVRGGKPLTLRAVIQ
jgi:hypothetical protein